MIGWDTSAVQSYFSLKRVQKHIFRSEDVTFSKVRFHLWPTALFFGNSSISYDYGNENRIPKYLKLVMWKKIQIVQLANTFFDQILENIKRRLYDHIRSHLVTRISPWNHVETCSETYVSFRRCRFFKSVSSRMTARSIFRGFFHIVRLRQRKPHPKIFKIGDVKKNSNRTTR